MQTKEKSLMTRSRTSQLACRLLLGTLVAAVPASSVIAASTASGGSLVVYGFETPESVVPDPVQDWYLVSNVGAGNPAALDGNGFISKVSPGGSVLDLTWIQSGVQGVTLNGPKGLALHGEGLYVADVDTLRVFDRRNGALVTTWLNKSVRAEAAVPQ
jgi:hypothetical protein